MSRGGKISRKHYAALVGVNETAVNVTLLDIFQEFEKRLGNPDRLHDLRLPEMRGYLEGELEAGRLGLRDGRIDRSGFMRHFGFKGGTLLTRYPAVRALFQEFDERVKQTGYVPFAVQDKLDELDAVLSGSPPLNKTGQAIDRTQVALRIGVPVQQMSVGPYATRLAEADRTQRERLAPDGRVVLLHGRKFDFVELAGLWPEPTVLAVNRRPNVTPLSSGVTGMAGVPFALIAAEGGRSPTGGATSAKRLRPVVPSVSCGA